MTTIKVSGDASVRAIARAAFPDYHGNTFHVSASDAPVSVISYWDGGSRSFFAAIDLTNLKRKISVPQNGTWFDGGPIAKDGVVVPFGYAIVEHSIFCGKDHGITIHIHPTSMPQNLIPEKVELSRDEEIVLIYTRSLKNTYAGVSNWRFHEAKREIGITRERWEAAKALLISKKLLNRAGAITASGENAVGWKSLYQLDEERQNRIAE